MKLPTQTPAAPGGRHFAASCATMAPHFRDEWPTTRASSAAREELIHNLSETTAATQAPTKNAKLSAWVERVAELTQPDSIHWCDGSAEEYDRLCQ